MSSHHPPALAEVEPHGFVYLGFHAEVPQRLPLYRPTPARRREAERLSTAADLLERRLDVTSVRIFRTHLVPPLPDIPRHDLAMLIRTTSVADLEAVRLSDDLRELGGREILAGVNAARIGRTESDPAATFLLNHFTVTGDADPVRAWLGLTGWYTSRIGVDNSTALRATASTGFALVNYVRLPSPPPVFLLDQLLRPSFHRVVGGTLKANGMRALPAFYRLIR